MERTPRRRQTSRGRNARGSRDVHAPRASFEELEIRTEDGVALRAVVDDPPEGVALRGTCVMAHAMFARKTEFGRRERPGLAQACAAAGWRTIAFDFRGHGESTLPKGAPEWGYDDLVRCRPAGGRRVRARAQRGQAGGRRRSLARRPRRARRAGHGEDGGRRHRRHRRERLAAPARDVARCAGPRSSRVAAHHARVASRAWGTCRRGSCGSGATTPRVASCETSCASCVTTRGRATDGARRLPRVTRARGRSGVRGVERGRSRDVSSGFGGRASRAAAAGPSSSFTSGAATTAVARRATWRSSPTIAPARSSLAALAWVEAMLSRS